MELNTLFGIACAILYILIAWRFYDGLDTILPRHKVANIISSTFWPGFIVVILAMLAVAIIVAIGVTIFLAGAFAVDLIRALFKGEPIKTPFPENEIEIEEEDE